MGKPAARISDLHICLQSTGNVPHIGGVIQFAGTPSVLIGGMPAVKVGDSCFCVGAINTVATGSGNVYIENKPAARLNDTTAHGGKITSGCPTVLIGG